MKRLILIACFLLLPTSLWAACSWTDNTGTVASPYAVADFNACFTDAASKTGAVVIAIPTATPTWATLAGGSMSTWTNVTSLTVQGNGTANTVITVGAVDTALSITAGTKTLVLKDITFTDGRTAAHSSGMVIVSGTGYRITNIVVNGFNDYSGSDTWAMSLYGKGLVDNSTFEAYDAGAGGIRIFGSNGGTGWSDWQTALTFGDVNATIIEDCAFTWPAQNSWTPDIAIDAYAGARWVLRNSTVTNTTVGTHGFDSGANQRSPISFEVYNNTFTSNNTYVGNFPVRGGTGLVYNNTYSGTAPWTGPSLQYFRASGGNVWVGYGGSQGWLTPATSDLKMCSNLGTDGSVTSYLSVCTSDVVCQAINASYTCNRMFNATDKDTICTVGDADCTYHVDGDGTGNSPGRDQPGRGPNQALRPIYVWDNGGKTASGTIANFIAENTDYCNHSPATDCGAVTGWSYTAYEYPHPLRNETPEIFTLTLTKAGGTGTVTDGAEGALDCGAKCWETYDAATSVTLTSSATEPFYPTGFTGCDTFTTTSCTVAMSAAKDVTATFGTHGITRGTGGFITMER